MKKTTFFYLALALFLGFSCKTDPVVDDGYVKPIYFSVTDSITMTFPPVVNINIPIPLPIPVNTQFDAEGQDVNPLIDLVENVTLNTVDMQIMSPSGMTFDFLKDVTIFMNAPGQNEIILAHLFNVPDNPGDYLELVPGTEKLDDYVKQDYTLRIEIRADKLPGTSDDIVVKSIMDLNVELTNY